MCFKRSLSHGLGFVACLLFFNVNAQNILYEDHFDTDEHWTVELGDVKFKKGKMSLSTDNDVVPMVTVKKLQPKDKFDPFVITTRFFSAEMTAQWVKDFGKGKTNTGFGVEYLPFRFEIKPDGSYSIYTKPQGSAWLVEKSSKGKPHPAIRTGSAENKLRIELRDDVISFWANDQLILKVNEAYPPSLQHYTTKNYSFKPFINGYQEVLFDDYVVKTVGVFDDLYSQPSSLDLDLESLFKTPAQQATATFAQYGITMQVNPRWIADKKQVIGSTIMITEKYKELELTFPDYARQAHLFSLTLALNPGTITEKVQQFVNLVFEDLNRYFAVNGQTLQSADWTNNYGKSILKTYYVTTNEGVRGELYVFDYPTVMFDKAEFTDASVSGHLLAVFLIQRPDNKVVQCTVEFERSFPMVKKPLPADISSFKTFGPSTKELCLPFLEGLFKTIQLPKN